MLVADILIASYLVATVPVNLLMEKKSCATSSVIRNGRQSLVRCSGCKSIIQIRTLSSRFTVLTRAISLYEQFRCMTGTEAAPMLSDAGKSLDHAVCHLIRLSTNHFMLACHSFRHDQGGSPDAAPTYSTSQARGSLLQRVGFMPPHDAFALRQRRGRA